MAGIGDRLSDQFRLSGQLSDRLRCRPDQVREWLISAAVVTRSIAAPVELVFDVVEDPTTYPEWLVGAKRIRGVDPSWPLAHSEFEHEVGGGPLTVHDTTEITLDRRARELRLIARARPLFEADVRFELGSDAAGTMVRMSERPRGVFVVTTPFARPFVRARNERSLRRLGEYVARSGRARTPTRSSP
jgi:uncharacterized protein YndB with AHSA1/START domain